MNRGQLEELAVRLYMLRMRNRIKKGDKANELARVKIAVTRWSDEYLIMFLDAQVTCLEVM